MLSDVSVSEVCPLVTYSWIVKSDKVIFRHYIYHLHWLVIIVWLGWDEIWWDLTVSGGHWAPQSSPDHQHRQTMVSTSQPASHTLRPEFWDNTTDFITRIHSWFLSFLYLEHCKGGVNKTISWNILSSHVLCYKGLRSVHKCFSPLCPLTSKFWNK